MPYILYKTDGTKLLTVDDASLDLSTDLSFVGKNYSGYGQVVNENFLKLLENFSSDVPPSKPLKGQLWFDKLNGRLNVSYDGVMYKGIASIFVQDTTPISTALVRGDLWWDSDAFQLKAFDGSQFQIIGPYNSAAGRANWIPSEEEIQDNAAVLAPISRSTIDDEIIAIASKQTFTTTNASLLVNFPVIKRGLTLANADANGNSVTLGTVLWGSAAHAVVADLASSATVAGSLVSGGTNSLRSSTSTVSITYYATATTATQVYTIVQRDIAGDVYSNTFRGLATSALYADLAERYHADEEYDVGTLLVLGGDKEVTQSTLANDTRVIGVVSQNPAYMMNSAAGNDHTHPYIALKGRVPCKVVGAIHKGDLLVTSDIPGHARKYHETDNIASVFAKAIQANLQDQGIIEVLVI